MIAMAPTYPLMPVAGNLLVGGAGAIVAVSVDSANPGSFGPPLSTGLGAATTMQVVADTNYATNNTIYAGDGAVVAAAGNFIYRWVIGTSTQWEPISAAALANRSIEGMAATNGVLYGLWSTGGALPSAADRSLNPTAVGGAITWDVANVGAAAGATFIATPSALKIDATTLPTLYAIDTTGVLVLSYMDNMATALTTINVPAAGSTITIDPVTGRAMPVTLNWAAMGFGPGLANTYQVLLFEESQGPAGAELFVVGPIAGPAIQAPTVDIVPVGQATAQDIGYNFVAGNSYGIMIRASNEVSTDAVLSNFCAPVVIDIEAGSGIISPPHAGPILLGPTPGAMDVPASIGFSWAPMAGVTEYELIIATDAALTRL